MKNERERTKERERERERQTESESGMVEKEFIIIPRHQNLMSIALI